MSVTFETLGIKFELVFKHRFNKKEKLLRAIEFKDWSLGFWFKRKAMMIWKSNKPKPTDSNYYMFGVNLLICKFWIKAGRKIK